MRVDGRSDDHPLSAGGSHRQVHRFHECVGAVVEGRVGDLHGEELADKRLELEQRLQHALGELCLIGGIGGCELGSGGERRNRSGNMMVVGAPSGEADKTLCPLRAACELNHISSQGDLVERFRHREVTPEAQLLGHRLEELLEPRLAQYREHLLDVLGGVWKEVHPEPLARLTTYILGYLLLLG